MAKMRTSKYKVGGGPYYIVINKWGAWGCNSTYVNKKPRETPLFSAISKGPLLSHGTVVMLRKLTGGKIFPHQKGGATNFTPENPWGRIRLKPPV